MSELKVDTLTGKTTANDITVTVGASATAKLEQGLCKAWHRYQTSASNLTLDSFNISSFTDSAVGKDTHSFTNSFDSVNFVLSGSGGRTLFVSIDDANTGTAGAASTTGSMPTIQYNYGGGLYDDNQANCMFSGDLA